MNSKVNKLNGYAPIRSYFKNLALYYSVGLASCINNYSRYFVFANRLSLKNQHCKPCVYLCICILSSTVGQCVI